MPRPFPRRKLGPVVAEATAAWRRGDDTYLAGLELRDGATATKKQLQQGERELVAAVEAIGWRFADSRMADPWTIEYLFVRVP